MTLGYENDIYISLLMETGFNSCLIYRPLKTQTIVKGIGLGKSNNDDKVLPDP